MTLRELIAECRCRMLVPTGTEQEEDADPEEGDFGPQGRADSLRGGKPSVPAARPVCKPGEMRNPQGQCVAGIRGMKRF